MVQRVGVLGCVLAAVLLRVPFLWRPLSSDEGGFLLVASQWHPGTSLYGDYWVDRPPVLIALFALSDPLSDVLGGSVGLRLLGCLAAGATVALAALIGHRIAGARGRLWCAIVAAGFVSMPLFGSLEVNGELLATPFVLGGLALLLLARGASGARFTLLLAAAGVSGATAVLVKQNFIDVFVFGAVFATAQLLQHRTTGRRLAHGAVAALSGAAVWTAAVAGGSWLLGTAPLPLFRAIVLFRFHASTVIADSSTGASGERFERYPPILLISGAALLLVLLCFRLARQMRPTPLGYATLALAGWELFAVLAGGSYWLHYLEGLVPVLVFATALLVAREDWLTALTRIGAGWASVVAVAVTAWLVFNPLPPATSQQAGEWLAHYARPHDTALVAYGAPNLLTVAGLSSPYPNLWSLPVRVRDPHLRGMSRVLRAADRPTWVLVNKSWQTWGIDPLRAERLVERHYRRVATVNGFAVYLKDDASRPPYMSPRSSAR